MFDRYRTMYQNNENIKTPKNIADMRCFLRYPDEKFAIKMKCDNIETSDIDKLYYRINKVLSTYKQG